MGAMKDFTSPVNFPSFQDLHLYGGELLDMQPHMDRSSLCEFLPTNINTVCLGKKRPTPYNGYDI